MKYVTFMMTITAIITLIFSRRSERKGEGEGDTNILVKKEPKKTPTKGFILKHLKVEEINERKPNVANFDTRGIIRNHTDLLKEKKLDESLKERQNKQEEEIQKQHEQIQKQQKERMDIEYKKLAKIKKVKQQESFNQMMNERKLKKESQKKSDE